MFDVAVIGGGATGAAAAHFCREAGMRVCIYEAEGIASQASGAAGAFISPRIGKGGKLQQLTNEAFTFATAFYKENFPRHFHETGIYRIARDEEDAKLFPIYAKHNAIACENAEIGGLPAFFFPSGGAGDAKELCEGMCGGSRIYYEKVTDLSRIKAKHIILATGAQTPLADLEYMGLRRTWGQRCDVKTDRVFQRSMHKDVSISATIGGLVRVGATHEKEVIRPQKCRQSSNEVLMEKARRLREFGEYEIVQSFCGMRSAVRDYFPVAGRVVDVARTLREYPMVKKGIKPRDGLPYRKNLYMIGGTGGRGFVFSPMIAKALAEFIAKGKRIDERIDPDRLFYKWARKIDQPSHNR